MKVAVRGLAEGRLGTGQMDFHARDDATVRDILDELVRLDPGLERAVFNEELEPRQCFRVLVNGRVAAPATSITENDIVMVGGHMTCDG